MVGLFATLLVAGGPDSLLVRPEWLARHLDDPRVVILHVADREEYDAGHVPGAQRADAMRFHSHEGSLPPAADMVSALEEVGVSTDSRIVVYGEGLWAGVMYVALEALGLGPRTSILDGGLAAWRAAGHPVSREPVRAARGRLTARPSREPAVDADWIAARLGKRGVTLLDGRTPAEYAGTAEESLPRTGHIPNARLLQWTEVMDAATGEFLPGDRLRSLLASRGVAPGDTVVTYCTVGMRASQLYVAAKLAGFPARVYIGSMADWSGRPELPVTRGAAPDR